MQTIAVAWSRSPVETEESAISVPELPSWKNFLLSLFHLLLPFEKCVQPCWHWAFSAVWSGEPLVVWSELTWLPVNDLWEFDDRHEYGLISHTEIGNGGPGKCIRILDSEILSMPPGHCQYPLNTILRILVSHHPSYNVHNYERSHVQIEHGPLTVWWGSLWLDCSIFQFVRFLAHSLLFMISVFAVNCHFWSLETDRKLQHYVWQSTRNSLVEFTSRNLPVET